MNDLFCPYCGEPAEVDVEVSDLEPGSQQEYVQDCAVCCRPWRVIVRAAEDPEAGDPEPEVTLLREDE